MIVSAVFWGGREGFHSIHNTDVAADLKHMASFFSMAVSKCEPITGPITGCVSSSFPLSACLVSAEYKEKIGLKCQFLIEPKPKEPCKHQYDYGEI